MNLWTLTLKLETGPFCPTCAADLLPDSTTFAEGIAVCGLCAPALRRPHLEILAKLMTFATADGEVYAAHGLSFWVGRPHRTPRFALAAGWLHSHTGPPVAKMDYGTYREIVALHHVQANAETHGKSPDDGRC